jgi:rhodanese-related sulfurtransferase
MLNFNVKEVDIFGLKTMQDQGQVRVIDVRTEGELVHGKIEGALHIPLHLIPLRLTELHGDVPAVLYCRSGARSAQACAFLNAQGIGNVLNLQGGIMAWLNAGFALTA